MGVAVGRGVLVGVAVEVAVATAAIPAGPLGVAVAVGAGVTGAGACVAAGAGAAGAAGAGVASDEHATPIKATTARSAAPNKPLLRSNIISSLRSRAPSTDSAGTLPAYLGAQLRLQSWIGGC